MKPYHPSNIITSRSLTWMAASSIVGGVVIGGMTHLVSLLVYLVLLFPGLMGLAGGGVLIVAIRRGKFRNPFIAGLFGVFTGCLIYSSMMGAGYLQFKSDLSEEITKEFGPVDAAESEAVIESFLEEETGSSGFWGFIKHSAKQGVSIGRSGNDQNNLGEIGTWIYWIIELLIIDSIVAAMAYSSAKAPFCESCDDWYQGEERLGSVPSQSGQAFLQLLNEDRFSQAGELLDPIQGLSAPNLEVRLQRCPSCQLSEPILSVSQTSLNNQGKVQLQEVRKGMVTQGEYRQLEQAVTHAQKQGEDIVSADEIRWAQQEREIISLDDSFEVHGLSPSEQENLVEQLSKYPQIKKAYLMRKSLQYFPEKPLYLLGIVRRRKLIESEVAESNLINKLMTELILPNQTRVFGLNQNKELTQVFENNVEQVIYSEKS